MEAAARGAAARRLPSWIYLDLAYTANYLFWINGDKRVAYFKRTKLAAELAAKLLHPGALDLEMRSGLFIAGQQEQGQENAVAVRRHEMREGGVGVSSFSVQ